MDDGYMVTTDLVIDLNWRMGEGGGSRIMPIAHCPEQLGSSCNRNTGGKACVEV